MVVGAYISTRTQEQDEIANTTEPTVKPDKIRPFESIYPCMSISAWQLNYPSQPKPNKAADLFDITTKAQQSS